MIELALQRGQEKLTLKAVARRQGISEKYLWQVAHALQKAGLIRATAGARGGYVLARPASAITLLDILTALEGDIHPVECVKRPGACDRSSTCAAREMWSEVGRKIAAVLGGVGLEGVAAQQRRISEAKAISYVI